ncbi:MAG: radical SAM protein [Erysipelotrichaceae bacterium]|nr:radical SAM protein [Erysipelotrichaceae bacterium]
MKKMATIKEKAMSLGIKTALQYIEKDPENNIGKIIDWLENADKDGAIAPMLSAAKTVLNDKNNNWTKLVISLFNDIDADVRKTLFENFIINTNVLSAKKRDQVKEEHNCNVPWAILLDPTTACNLKCTGCWAAEYGGHLHLSYETIDSIIEQGKELGTYMYIYTGGEPMVRKHDLIRLCEKHSDCVFLAFTNATLIDERFTDEMLRVKNFVPAISIEGFEEATDFRRGNGIYRAAVSAMELMKRKKLPFGVSCCYTSKNLDSLSSEEFIDHLIGLGAKFAWFFHYMPVGNNAVTELLPTAKQREQMYHRIRDYRTRKPLFTIDFQNDGEYVGGCIAGGRNYLHINANGDVEPCVFIHYSDTNIHQSTLLDALKAPLFMAYKENQPFNCNHLMPCPMLENPECLKKMVNETGAKSTDLMSPESVEHLCAKCTKYSNQWKETADYLWKQSHSEKE